jgi:hypothetical protein
MPEPESPQTGSPRYYLIGGDSREYGPASEEQLKEWIAQHRANATTRVRREDQKNFSSLGSFPEFAETLGRSTKAPPPPPPKPPLDASQADQLATEIIGRGYEFSVSRCFQRSWSLLVKNFPILAGVMAVAIVLEWLVFLVPLVGLVAVVALAGVFWAGLSVVYLKTIRGQKAVLNDLFAGFNRGFVPLLLAGVVSAILVSAGSLLCLLPGIYLAVAWMFAHPLVFERSLDFWPAMELSRRVVHERWWELFALALGVAALIAIGGLIFGFGVFLTAPLAFGALMYAYEDIFGEPAESLPKYDPPAAAS